LNDFELQILIGVTTDKKGVQ